MRDYYDVLGVPPGAGADEIERVYRQLARRSRPDISGDDRGAVFLEVLRAYDVLSDPARRHYDSGLRRHDSGQMHGRAEWLADEVDIDFPSVSSLLDRMRHSFFGAAPAVGLRAVIVLSPQEAFWGTTVPIAVPLRRTCTRCGGRGETWQEWCAPCDGGGEVASSHELTLRVPASVHEGARFSRFSVMPPGAPHTMVEVHVSIR